ncbi:MAG: hypothetical protein KDC54_20870 [Lewinella sp.]|nr:hypothetical protein [Lewinella sp.]
MRACCFLLAMLFMALLTAQSAIPFRNGLTLLVMAGQSAAPVVNRDYVPADDAYVHFQPSVSFAGELRYRAYLGAHWELIGGLGFGGNAFHYDLYADPSFTGFDWTLDTYAQAMPAFQAYGTAGVGHYRRLGRRLALGLDLLWQGGYFFSGTNSTSHSMTDETGRFLNLFQLRYGQDDLLGDGYQALVVSPGLRWRAADHLLIYAHASSLFTDADILHDNRFTLAGEAKAYAGSFDLPYGWWALQLELAYQW